MRIVRSLLLALLVLVAAALGGVWFYLDQATELALESGGERMLGVSTQVGSVGVLPFTGSIKLRDVRIANPPGFSADPFLVVGSGRAKIALGSIATDQVEISSIVLDDLVLRLEKPGAHANYEKLGETGADAETPDDSNSRRSVVVRSLTLRNVTAFVDGAVHGKGTGDLELKIPEIVLTDVGSDSEGGMMADELSQVVIGAIVNALVKKGLTLPVTLVTSVGVIPVKVTGEVLRGVGNVAGDGGKVLGDVIGGTVGTAGKGVEQAAGALRSLLGGGAKDAEEGDGQ